MNLFSILVNYGLNLPKDLKKLSPLKKKVTNEQTCLTSTTMQVLHSRTQSLQAENNHKLIRYTSKILKHIKYNIMKTPNSQQICEVKINLNQVKKKVYFSNKCIYTPFILQELKYLQRIGINNFHIISNILSFEYIISI